jgi:hypothetical protein
MRTTDVINARALEEERIAAQSGPKLRSLKLAVRIRPAHGARNSDFSLLLTELEDRFLGQENSTGADGDIRTVVLLLWSNKRDLLTQTLSKHGYEIKDEFEL